MQEFKRQNINSKKLPPKLVEKWSASVLAEGFVPFPKKLLRSMHQIFPDVEAVKELTVLLAIVDFKRPNLTRPPSLAYLSFLAGLEIGDFDATLSRLEQKGFIRVEDRNPEGLEVSMDGLFQRIESATESS